MTQNKIPTDEKYVRARASRGVYGQPASSPALAFVFWCTILTIGLIVFGLAIASKLG